MAAGSAGGWLESWYCERCTRCRFVNAPQCHILAARSPGWSGNGSNNHCGCSCTGYLREPKHDKSLFRIGSACPELPQPPVSKSYLARTCTAP